MPLNPSRHKKSSDFMVTPGVNCLPDGQLLSRGEIDLALSVWQKQEDIMIRWHAKYHIVD
jgi:hypothetical protein